MPMVVGDERWRLKEPFAIARGIKTEAHTVVVRISDGKHVGAGECVPYARYGETVQSVLDQIWPLRERIKQPADRPIIQELLPAGAARNALDCALWDLEAKQSGESAAKLAGLTPQKSVETAVTISLGAPEEMAQAAKRMKAPVLKIKLGAGGPEAEIARLEAVRKAAAKATLIVDANEGWDLETLKALDPICTQNKVLFIEQPLPAADDAKLDGLGLTTPLCADESCHHVEDLPKLQGRYQVVNIKLDKTGGLTAAIALREAAMAQGFGVMIGCMVAGSLAMAPAFMLTQNALAVDLDGPLLLRMRHPHAIEYQGARMFAPSAELWG